MRKASGALYALILAPFVVAGVLPASYTIHERRQDTESLGLAVKTRLDAGSEFSLRIAMKQSNLDNAEDWLMSVSDPKSDKFGKFWTKDDVATAFRPSDESIKSVVQWLLDNGVEQQRILQSDDKQWLKLNVTANEAEELFQTEYYEYNTEGHTTIGCDSYNLPISLRNHIDFINPGVKVAAVSKRTAHRLSASWHLRHRTADQAPTKSTDDLSNCDKVITPECIQALYGIPPLPNNASVSPNNTLGIYERGDYFAQEDLNEFFARFAPSIRNGTQPIVKSIDGGMAPVPQSQAGDESDLDLQIAYPIIYPQTITVYQTDDQWYAWGGDPLAGGQYNTFLDALDGSYCSYSAYGETGNDPTLDPTYPDGHDYNGTLMCGVYKPANVISVSYGLKESTFPVAYQKRQCNEFLKLGLQGVSLFWSAGDSGVQGDHNAPPTYGCMRNGTVFNPTYPNNCPWITNVGATTVEPGNTVYDPESAVYDPAGVLGPAAFFTSGGFSNIYPIPKYQQQAVETFFRDHNPPYPYYYNGNYENSTGVYNRNGRGIPDVAANGNFIATIIRGEYHISGGTSASAPLFASVVNRIVEERLRAGKGPLGFINPALYQNPAVLNDIVNGTNPGCGTQGFSCAQGWDPVSGLGTPSYPRMLEYFLSLP